jgi:hypothetical protein
MHIRVAAAAAGHLLQEAEPNLPRLFRSGTWVTGRLQVYQHGHSLYDYAMCECFHVLSCVQGGDLPTTLSPPAGKGGELEIQRGQRTAIVTGGISLLFGVRSSTARHTMAMWKTPGVGSSWCGRRGLDMLSLGPTLPPHPTKVTHRRNALRIPCCQVLYLALVSFLDLRGGELLPPPPEAFGP